MNLDLSGRKALVTGSTKGIGYATAAQLAEMGASVFIHGRTADGVSSALKTLRAQHPNCHFEGVSGDVGVAADAAAIIKQVPTLDILVNNAALAYYSDVFEVDDAAWREMLEVNLIGALRFTRHYIRQMLDRNWGRIVHVSSESGAQIPGDMIQYGTSKAALLALSRGFAELTKGTGVTVNSVLPGPTLVDEAKLAVRASERGMSSDEYKSETFRVRRSTSLLQRYLSAEEVANMICYVCSPAAVGTNGAPLRVEGGIVRAYT